MENRGIIEFEKELVKNYPNLHNAFYTGKLSEEKLTNYVTQPFWHSLKHSKKCINRNGVTVECKTIGKVRMPRIKSRDKNREVSVREYQQKVKEEKRVFLNNQCIYKKKDKKLYNTSIIEVKTETTETICPNCGAKGAVSSFIDGCDFCGTKFLVNNSVNKISSFSSQENTGGKVVGFFVKLLIILAIVALIFGIGIIGGFVLAIIFDVAVGWYTHPEMKTIMPKIILLSQYIFPEVMKLLFISLVIFAVAGIILVRKSTKKIEGEEVVYNLVRDIVPENFAQNLEYKLRCIHYANSNREVAVFSTMDLGTIVQSYNNVIETSMNKMTILDAGVCPEGIYVDVEASLINLRLINAKVKEENELVKVRLVARHDMKEQSFDSISTYKCAGCGGSIDLFEGGFCSSCGAAIDYGRFNWMITAYKSMGKTTGSFKKISFILAGIFTACLLTVCGVFFAKNRPEIELFSRLDELYIEAASELEDFDTPDEICRDVELINREEYDIIRINTYETNNAKDDVETYLSYLYSIGFDEDIDDLEKGTDQYENIIKLVRHHNFEDKFLQDELSAQIIIIEYDDGGDEINVIFDVE